MSTHFIVYTLTGERAGFTGMLGTRYVNEGRLLVPSQDVEAFERAWARYYGAVQVKKQMAEEEQAERAARAAAREAVRVAAQDAKTEATTEEASAAPARKPRKRADQ